MNRGALMAAPSRAALDRAMPDTASGGKHQPHVWHHGAEGERLDLRAATQARRAIFLYREKRLADLAREGLYGPAVMAALRDTLGPRP